MTIIVKIVNNKDTELGLVLSKQKAILELSVKYVEKIVTQHQIVLKNKHI
jgi:hypothetical protein